MFTRIFKFSPVNSTIDISGVGDTLIVKTQASVSGRESRGAYRPFRKHIFEPIGRPRSRQSSSDRLYWTSSRGSIASSSGTRVPKSESGNVRQAERPTEGRVVSREDVVDGSWRGAVHWLKGRIRFVSHCKRGQPQVVDEGGATLVTESLHAAVDLGLGVVAS